MALIDGLKNIGDAIREKNGTTELIPFKDMPQAIKDISGGGTSYTGIVFNEDNTITLTDTEGAEHTMVCEYEDGKFVSISYDGTEIPLSYDGDDLVGIGGASVDLSNIMVKLDDKLYEHFGVDKATYPYVAITYNYSGYNMFIYFASAYTQDAGYISLTGNKLMVQVTSAKTVYNESEGIVDWIILYVNKTPTENTQVRTMGNNATSVEFTNFDCVLSNTHYML